MNQGPSVLLPAWPQQWDCSGGAPGFRGRAGSFLWTAGRRLSTARGRTAPVLVGIGCTTQPGRAGGPGGCRSWLL